MAAGRDLYHTVSVPMQTGPDLKGVLAAGYAHPRAAGRAAPQAHPQRGRVPDPRLPATGGAPLLSVSSLGPKEPALRAAMGAPEFVAGVKGSEPFQIDLGSERYVAVAVPLKAADGDAVGTVLALRSLAEEMAAFRQFRTSLVLASVVVMVVALALAMLVASRIAGPVRRLATVVERARGGQYTGKVAVETGDEIGVLAQTFNNLLADLREKEQMIGFLREGMTILRKGSGVTSVPTAPRPPTPPPRRARPASPARSKRWRRPGSGSAGRSSPAATRSWPTWARAGWARCSAPRTASSTKWSRSRCCAATC